MSWGGWGAPTKSTSAHGSLRDIMDGELASKLAKSEHAAPVPVPSMQNTTAACRTHDADLELAIRLSEMEAARTAAPTTPWRVRVESSTVTSWMR